MILYTHTSLPQISLCIRTAFRYVTRMYIFFLVCAYARMYGTVHGTCDSKHNFDMLATFSTKYIRHARMSVTVFLFTGGGDGCGVASPGHIAF